MLSSDMVSEAPGVLLFLGVILTVRKAVFICGVTEEIVPEMIVPFLSSRVTDSFWHFMRNLDSVMLAHGFSVVSKVGVRT